MLSRTAETNCSTKCDNVYAPYTGPVDPKLELLVERAYSRHRSRLVDYWIQYADLEGLLGDRAPPG